MVWVDLEQSFNRAFLKSFSWREMVLTCPALLLCGVVIVFCHALYIDAGSWAKVGLIFLPILLSCAILLSVGVLIARMYQHDLKNMPLSFHKLVMGSLDALLHTSYFSIPSILTYMLLWIGVGIFFLFTKIPGFGDLVKTLLAFVPFLLILGFVGLCLLHVAALFFVTPEVAKYSVKRIQLLRALRSSFQQSPFMNLILFCIALVPVGLVMALLIWVASLTSIHIIQADSSWLVALQWFFMMIPFSVLLTPAVIFFFHFAVEANQLRAS